MRTGKLDRSVISVLSLVLLLSCIVSKPVNLFQHFFRDCLATILVLLYQTLGQYSDKYYPNRGTECNGYETIALFDQHLVLSRT